MLKIKKYYVKLKEKIIHLLGGYINQDYITPKISITQRQIIKLTTAIQINMYELKEVEKDYLKRELSFQIAQEMLKSGCIEFSQVEPNILYAYAYVTKLD